MPVLEGFPTPIERAVVPGGANATGLAPVPGLAAGDTLIGVRHISADLVTNDDVLAEASITDDGEVTLTTTDTTGNYVLVIWTKAA